MRYIEFSAKKPTTAKTPSQLRIHALQKNIEQQRRALAVERERQRRAKELERQQQASVRLRAKG
ncbi:hypothetical protein [Orrella daihaiensis]|uniref:Uncharacterized protein n=1 Tax=Orrella daihaiensis TaxID=2782176 RepID=A0ABY4AMT0_9BURK|nr:hypothetical protein [Orrella daihaiensis]UOD50377.1 hypothetical protein DHf2319_00010 [Orrella daihaiensis]